MNAKPKWLLYAAQVSEELERVPATKSGKPYERHLNRTWNKACSEMGYQGSERDWDYLVHHFDRVNRVRNIGKRV